MEQTYKHNEPTRNEPMTAKSNGYIECIAITIPKHANTGVVWKHMSVITEKKYNQKHK